MHTFIFANVLERKSEASVFSLDNTDLEDLVSDDFTNEHPFTYLAKRAFAHYP